MSVAKVLPLLAVALLVAAPAADAYAQPVFYFLKDQPSPTDGVVPSSPVPVPVPIPIPTLDINAGILDPYDPKAPNAPNSTTSKERLVTPGTDAVIPVQFITPGNHSHPMRIKGPLFFGLWTGQTTVLNGNLTATVYEKPAEGDLVPIAAASVALDFNQSSAPDPTALIPQNTTDPTVIAYYELAQVYPMLLHPPALFIIPVDLNLSADSSLAVGFKLDQGSSPTPLPTGAQASIQYDGLVTPSFLYVPWYSPDPPKPTPTPRPTTSFGSSRSYSGSIPTTDQVIVGDDEKGSPGFELPLSLAALGAIALAIRRRAR